MLGATHEGKLLFQIERHPVKWWIVGTVVWKGVYIGGGLMGSRVSSTRWGPVAMVLYGYGA